MPNPQPMDIMESSPRTPRLFPNHQHLRQCQKVSSRPLNFDLVLPIPIFLVTLHSIIQVQHIIPNRILIQNTNSPATFPSVHIKLDRFGSRAGYCENVSDESSLE